MLKSNWISLSAIVLLTCGLGGCWEKKEKTPTEKIEDAAEDAGDAVEDTAEDVGDAVEDAVD